MNNSQYTVKLYNKILTTLDREQFSLITDGENRTYRSKLAQIELVTRHPETKELCREMRHELNKIKLVFGDFY